MRFRVSSQMIVAWEEKRRGTEKSKAHAKNQAVAEICLVSGAHADRTSFPKVWIRGKSSGSPYDGRRWATYGVGLMGRHSSNAKKIKSSAPYLP